MISKMTRGLVLGGVLMMGASCQDLDVVNTQDPNREQALARPEDVQSLIAGTFSTYFQAVHGQPAAATCCSILHLFLNLGPEMTTTNQWWATVPSIRQPRTLFNNSPDIPNFTGPHGPRDLWRLLNRTASNAHDGLRAIRDGMTFTEGNVNVTARAEAFAKFMQGVAWGHLAMTFDQVIIIPESVALETTPQGLNQQAAAALLSYKEARDRAVEALQAAVTIAQSNTFTIPVSTQWFGLATAMNNQQFVQLANTMAARILVLNARTPEERAQVDWARVLQLTGNGLTFDFGTQLQTGVRTSPLYAAAQGPNPGQGFTCCYRMDYTTVGPADVSGQYQQWLQTPLEQRTRFNILTPDRRVTGATPTSNGAYLRYRADDNGFDPVAGTYLFSAYQWGRHVIRNGQGNTATATASNVGLAFLATADENRLLRAEALLRTNDLQGAVDLINVTRTRQHNVGGSLQPGLPALTTAGVPQSATCVPRTDTGACADLMTALRYERMLELSGLDALRGYADGRGFGLLPDGTPLHFPIPGNELDLLGMPVYSFGGVGSQWGAVYLPVTMP